MQAHFSTRALLLLSSLIHLSIAAVIPSSDDFFSTEPFPSFDSAFNDGSSPSNRLALAPTTPYVETAPQEELTNFNTDLLAEEPTSTLDQGGQQGVTSGQFILPENNGLPTLEQSSPNQLQAPTKLNTGDTQPLPGPNTLVCKNANEPIPVCHNMHERTLLPPPLDIEMCTT
ncbi:hypothetical protein MMC31_005647, partial [Peltigera leucophlebia]|nr:hypothetical protein [Peltigera leucophlebia]